MIAILLVETFKIRVIDATFKEQLLEMITIVMRHVVNVIIADVVSLIIDVLKVIEHPKTVKYLMAG